MFHYQRPPISSSHPSTSPWEMPSPAGFFVTFAMIAGAIGVASTIAGINHICRWNDISLPSAASIAGLAWIFTLLGMGFACKEIELEIRNASSIRI
ncbi:hypothetical protein V6N12_008876 [Hibiscus sabdariffa]|uniref:Uncharacterized protein n=1 Tax=Hibiscus sabdariffa TaxID=183260 RepID=A0ABR2C422_9ROSI